MNTATNFADLVKSSARSDGYRFLGLSTYKWSETASVNTAGNAISSLIIPSLEKKFTGDLFYEYARAHVQPWSQIVDAGKTATYFLHLDQSANGILGNIGNIQLNADSNWEGVIIQDWSADAQTFIRLGIDVAQGARGKLFIVQKGSAKSQLRIEACLNGANAELEINVLTLGASDQVLENWISIKHLAPHTKSNVYGTAVLRDRSHSIFKGILDIGKEAPYSNAFQKSKNLMMSTESRVDTIPQLWIAQDEVKCAHGASVSQVDPEQSFYLQARGLTRDEAEQWISSGLIHDRTQTITDKELRTRAEKACGVDKLEVRND